MDEPVFRQENGYTITEAVVGLPGGLNMRNSMCLVDKCQSYPNQIFLKNKDSGRDPPTCDGKSIMQAMMLCGFKGARIEIQVEGVDQTSKDIGNLLYKGITSRRPLSELFYPNDPAYRSSIPYE
jgi:phosphotransferase system HPr (HPr) family protein